MKFETVKNIKSRGGNSHGTIYHKDGVQDDEHTKYYDLEVVFTPKEGQKKIIELAQNRRLKKIIVNVFRQYGKSFVCRYLTLYWMQTPNTTVGYITQTGRLAKDIYKKFVNMFPSELVKAKDGKDFIIELVNGSKIIFFSVEQTQAIRGFTLDYLIWDEVSHSREYTPDGEHIYYNIIAPLLDAKGKKEIYISTPNGAQGFFYDEYIKAVEEKHEKYAYIKISVDQDETKTQEWIDDKRAHYPESAWQQEYMCEFLEGGISYFKGFGKLFTEKDVQLNKKLYVGVDFSSVGEDDCVVSFMTEERKVKQYIVRGDLEDKYDQIVKLLNNNSKWIQHVYMESNSIGEVMAHDIKKRLPIGLRNRIDLIYTSNESKKDYIEKLALDIEQGNLTFEETNQTLNEQFKTYVCTKSKTGKKVFNATDGHHDDTVIALALSNKSYWDKANKTSNNIMVIRR